MKIESSEHSPQPQQPARIALVTGGSRGIGKSIALMLASRGVDVLITYRTAQQEARSVVAEIEARGQKAAALALDVSAVAGFGAFMSEVKATLGRVWQRDRLDFLVNNAGSSFGRVEFADLTVDQLDEMYGVHLRSVFCVSQGLLPHLVDGGRIVNISSALTRYTNAGQSAYAAMKAAVEVLSRYMAVELGSRGITVNVVAPGLVDTDLTGGALLNPAVRKAVSERTALGRVGLPADIAGAVAMLLADESGWITGQRIEVTGGFSL